MYISILSLYILSQIIIKKEITIFVRNEKQVENVAKKFYVESPIIEVSNIYILTQIIKK